MNIWNSPLTVGNTLMILILIVTGMYIPDIINKIKIIRHGRRYKKNNEKR